MQKRTARIAAPVAAAGIVAAALSGCAGGGTGGSGDGPVELTYWTWSAATAAAVDVWNEQNPDIQVETVDMGRAEEQTAKLLAAVRVDEGPDLFQSEYHTVPSYAVSDVALDITELLPDIEAGFTESVWNLVNLDGASYAVPVDLAPMVMYYRTDILESAGVEVPTTWDEYRAAGEAITAMDPSITMTVFPPSDFGFFTGLAQQVGSSWYEVDGGEWSVNVNSDADKKVAEYWDGLVREGIVDASVWWTPEWTEQLATGKIATFPVGAWLAGSLGDLANPDDFAKWQVAPLPTWEEGDPTGFMGGSAAAVAATSDHPEEAAEFLAWLASDPEAAAAMVEGGEYPASVAGQEALTGAPQEGIGGDQADFYDVISTVASDTASVTWGPNVVAVSTSFRDELGRALQSGGSFADALDTVQEFAVEDLEAQGFEVK